MTLKLILRFKKYLKINGKYKDSLNLKQDWK